eukprot:6470128-Amphidinium_carterae.1
MAVFEISLICAVAVEDCVYLVEGAGDERANGRYTKVVGRDDEWEHESSTGWLLCRFPRPHGCGWRIFFGTGVGPFYLAESADSVHPPAEWSCYPKGQPPAPSVRRLP